MSDKKAIQARLNAARRELDEIERRERDERNASSVGKCFKYRNSYSCSESDADRWWLYMKVVSIGDGHLRGVAFQRDRNGKVEIETRSYEGTSGVLSGYTEISEDEMRAAWREIFDDVSAVMSSALDR